MSLKPIAPKNKLAKRGVRPAGMPVVVVQKKSSGGGGMILGLILLLALGGGGFYYYNQQQNEAALAAQKQRQEENARKVAEVERQRAEHQASKRAGNADYDQDNKTALGTALATDVETSVSTTPDPSYSDDEADVAMTEEEEGEKSALGATSAPSAGDGVFKVEDTSAPVYDLAAKGNAAKKVMEALDKAIDKAEKEQAFHDLQADLKRAFEVAHPELFADAATLPSFPAKEEKLLRMAQGVYTCLVLTSELEARNTVPEKDHARFVAWLMKDKAKAARTFTYGVVEHCGITETEAAADLLEEVRQAYLISPSSGMKKIPAILKEKAKG